MIGKSVNEIDAPPSPWGIGTTESAQVSSDESSAPRAEGQQRSRWLPVGLAALVGVLSLLVPLRWGGLWAPYELETAELARRMGVALYGATKLELAGSNNTVPTLTELGRGQLPFSLVAFGFQFFGLRDWAGRLPLALCGGLGLAVTFAFVARLRDRWAATYATLALASIPLYFLQARTLLGDIVTLTAVALAASGLAVSTFHAPALPRGSRFAWGLLALLGLLGGFASRGVLFGIACPALGVGAAWLIWRLSAQRCSDRFGEVAGAFSLALGLAALGVGIRTLLSRSPEAYLELLGARLNEATKLPTHDQVLHQLGFGLFPWSALAPFAIAILLSKPAPAADEVAGRSPPEQALRITLVCVLATAFAFHGVSAPYIGVLPFVGTFAIAAVLGVALRDAETTQRGTRLIAFGTASLLIVFVFDLRSMPEQSLLPFVVGDTTFPESFARAAKAWVQTGTGAALLLLLLALGELPSAPLGCIFAADGQYAAWVRKLTESWRGRLVWLLLGLTFLLGTFPVLRWLSLRGLHIGWIDALGAWSRPLGYAFLVIPCLVLVPPGFWLVRDLTGALLNWLPLSRPRLALLALTGAGLVLSLGYYPALASQLSPRDVFGSFRARAKPGDGLAVLGATARVAPYYTGAQVHEPASLQAGVDWLLEKTEQRRWLVIGAKDLAQINHAFREGSAAPRANLPILDATSSEVMLASNQLGPGEHNDNPLSQWVSSEAPLPERPLDVDLNGQLHCLGWSITDLQGRPVARVVTGRPYDFRIYWQVLSPIASSWQTFIHIDGNHRRYNGDHETLEGKYPFKYWLVGDYVTDVHRIEIEPNFSGSTYEVYFGMFIGDKRLAVRRGAEQDNRIVGGTLVIY
jgi:4-amino-4-deoxy-L-arabinose transferase-like glycosyltransferase